MPRSPASACEQPGCGELASHRGRCPQHQPVAWSVRPRSDRVRGKRGDWLKLRARVLNDEPHCAVCSAPATEVDHVQPLALGGAMWERANLQPLCHEHHKAKTRTESYRAQYGDRSSNHRHRERGPRPEWKH